MCIGGGEASVSDEYIPAPPSVLTLVTISIFVPVVIRARIVMFREFKIQRDIHVLYTNVLYQLVMMECWYNHLHL
jgi:hypothetical protein